MLVTRTSPLTKLPATLELDVTPEQLARWRAGEVAQHVFPTLTAADREFIISGCTPADWLAIYGPEEEEV